MKIGGHGLREHIRLLMPLFGLITAVWLLRLIMDKAGTPPAIVRIVSVTVAGSASILLAVLLIHFKGFGSYSNVVLAAFLIRVLGHSFSSVCRHRLRRTHQHRERLQRAGVFAPQRPVGPHLRAHNLWPGIWHVVFWRGYGMPGALAAPPHHSCRGRKSPPEDESLSEQAVGNRR